MTDALTLRYQRRRNRARARGEWQPWGDLAAVKKHLNLLISRQWTNEAIAAAGGVAVKTIDRIRNGQARGVYVGTAEAILAVQPHRWPAGYRRCAVGYARRLQALAVQGHGLPTVSAATGMGRSWLSQVRLGQYPTVSARHGDALEAAYEHLRTQDPPPGRTASRVRAGARAHGWAPASAWNRYTIDDPDARPLADVTRWGVPRPRNAMGAAGPNS